MENKGKTTKLLFIMESLRIGGAEKSLLSLLSQIDYEKYDVELMLFDHHGELMGFLPSQVKLLPEDRFYREFSKNRKTAPIRYLLRGDRKRFWHSLKYLIKAMESRIRKTPLYIGWENVQKLFEEKVYEADVAVAYLERKTIYFTAEYVKAPYKLGFIHNDYSQYPFDRYLDEKYFMSYDKIAAVSEHCREVLMNLFPEYADKFVVVKNTIQPSLIDAMAREPLALKKENGEVTIVTVGRLVVQKGYDMAIHICKSLREKNIPIKWYAVGAGPEKEKLLQMIEENDLCDRFFLTGATANPYNWMKAADIYVQPSRFEGFGITVSEAKALNKKIVCSGIPEFREQLNGYPNVLFAKVCDIGAFQEAIIAMMDRKLQKSDCDDHEDLDEFYSAIGVCRNIEESI